MSNVVAAPPTGGGTYTEKEINDGKAMAAIGYFCLCCLPGFLLPMLGAKENKFAQYHAKQSMTLYVAMVAVVIVVTVLNFVLGMLHLGICSMILGPVAGIAILVLMIIGMINAFQGQAKELPVLGQFAGKMPG